jgi:hypothetical protein
VNAEPFLSYYLVVSLATLPTYIAFGGLTTTFEDSFASFVPSFSTKALYTAVAEEFFIESTILFLFSFSDL